MRTRTFVASSVAIAALAATTVAVHVTDKPSWDQRCIPVINAGPGKYPASLENQCDAWNVRQAAVYERTHNVVDGK